jgi:predicted nuclease of predicted toxin-antitoxin system
VKILIDMNLSLGWVGAFAAENIDAVHWSTIGDPRAEDEEIMAYARTGDYIVFTHDLDFGAMLALTQAKSPSVIQVRTQNILPPHLAKTLISVLRSNEEYLEQGALIVVDENRARVRILPLQGRKI